MYSLLPPADHVKWEFEVLSTCGFSVGNEKAGGRTATNGCFAAHWTGGLDLLTPPSTWFNKQLGPHLQRVLKVPKHIVGCSAAPAAAAVIGVAERVGDLKQQDNFELQR